MQVHGDGVSVASEADRFPEVAADYVERSWNRNQHLLAEALAVLAARGALTVDDAEIAAEQFTWLVLAAPLNMLTLQGGTRAPDARELQTTARHAVTTFLSRYGVPASAGAGRRRGAQPM